MLRYFTCVRSTAIMCCIYFMKVKVSDGELRPIYIWYTEPAASHYICATRCGWLRIDTYYLYMQTRQFASRLYRGRLVENAHQVYIVCCFSLWPDLRYISKFSHFATHRRLAIIQFGACLSGRIDVQNDCWGEASSVAYMYSVSNKYIATAEIEWSEMIFGFVSMWGMAVWYLYIYI